MAVGWLVVDPTSNLEAVPRRNRLNRHVTNRDTFHSTSSLHSVRSNKWLHRSLTPSVTSWSIKVSALRNDAAA